MKLTERHNDGASARRADGNRCFSQSRPVALSPRRSSGGWTLIELVITMTVMTVLTLAVIPIVRTSIRRQREVRLHDALRQMRNAIDEFKRDTVGMQCGAGGAAVIQQQQQQQGGPPVPGAGYIDPRSRVVISDCKIFGAENPDKYPPDLQTLVDGVDVVQRANLLGAQAGRGLDSVGGQATDNAGAIPKKKRYLREIPIDPVTGKPEWCILSNYDESGGDCSSSASNVFDVRSNAKGEALNGEKYSDW